MLLINILAMIVLAVLLVFGVFKALNVYARHGQAIVVPDVKGQNVMQAQAAFEDAGLKCVVNDSTYVKDKPAGIVLDYTPQSGQKVKEGRTIYLTINTRNAPMIVVPDVADNSSLRQAEARLLAAGFKLDETEYITGEKDWVYSIKYKEETLNTGQKIPVGSTLKLVVGDGTRDNILDDELGLDADTLNLSLEESFF